MNIEPHEGDALITTATGYPLTRVQCDTCGWFNESGDHSWTKHSAVVHSQMLRPGHATRVTIVKGRPA